MCRTHAWPPRRNDLQFVETRIYLYNVGVHTTKTGITAYKREVIKCIIAQFMSEWTSTKKIFLSAATPTRKKKQILAFFLRHGYRYDGTKNHWTQTHINWLRTLKVSGLYQEILEEYLLT